MFYEKVKLKGGREFTVRIDNEDLTACGRHALGLDNGCGKCSFGDQFIIDEGQIRDLRGELRRLKANQLTSSRPISRPEDKEVTITPSLIEHMIERALNRIDLEKKLRDRIKDIPKIIIGKLQGKVF